jgi:flagellar biosynthetic protein FliR
MPWSMVEIYLALPAFLLVLSRVAGLMLASPLFSATMLPGPINALLAVAISLAVFPLAAAGPALPVTLGSAVTGMAGELAIGLVLGLGVSLVFAGVEMAAQLMSQQAGIALGEVFNPMMETSGTEVSQLYSLVAIMVFLGVGGHHALVRALLDSFATIPPLGFKPTPGLVELIMDVATLSFTIAIRVGGPVILALILSFLMLGFISRTVPQLNLLSVGFPVKLAMALFIMAVSMISMESILVDGLNEVMEGLRGALGMTGAMASR